MFEWGVPRVWLKDVDMPVRPVAQTLWSSACPTNTLTHTCARVGTSSPSQGLAMARSFGDIAAESVGVFAEPELSKVTLNHTHPFLIWASDGMSIHCSTCVPAAQLFRSSALNPAVAVQVCGSSFRRRRRVRL